VTQPRLALALLTGAALLSSACGPVRSHWVRDDYAQVDRAATLRLRVVVEAPAEATAPEEIWEMWALIARRYANQKRDFIVSEHGAAEGAFDLAAACEEGYEGILRLEPTLTLVGAGAEATLKASLLRCHDGAPVWRAEAGGTWPQQDPVLEATVQEYVEEYDEGVRPYVAPVFHLSKAALDTLPKPTLPPEAVDEKIDAEL